MKLFRAISERLRKKQEFHYASISSYGICDSIFRADGPVQWATLFRLTDWIHRLSASAGSVIAGLVSH